jgi:flagellar biosynthetic protein FliP
MGQNMRKAALTAVLGVVFFAAAGCAYAAVSVPAFDFVRAAQTPQEVNLSLQIMFLLTVLSVAPAILLMMTSFTRIAVVLGFLKQAIGIQSIPGQLIVGLALFLTLFVMKPVWQEVNSKALAPYVNGIIDQDTAFQNAVRPVKAFMLRQTREKDIALFVHISKSPVPRSPSDVGLTVLIPAYIISELRTAFVIGFVLYVPFLIIDMVVSCILMSMGMMMLPPAMIALPFKLLLFVLVDGWYLVVKSVVESFR